MFDGFDGINIFWMVAMLAEKNPAEHGDAWERISLNRNDPGEWLISGQG
jgi:hypothetical protein